MKGIIFFLIGIIIVVGLVLVVDEGILSNNKDMEKASVFNEDKKIRQPAAAGLYYPDSEEELSSMIDGFLEKTTKITTDKYIKALIVPHAGYVYSGQTAAHAYKLLEDKDIEKVILIGNSHKEYFEGISVYKSGYYRTPLGDVEVDEEFAKQLINSHDKIFFKESAHSEEHILEVQLPFLQKTLGLNNYWKIVPIIIGNQSESVDILIDALKGLIDDKTLLIASSDLSHYPDYDNARYSDNKVIDAILTGKIENLRTAVSKIKEQGIANLETCVCSQEAIEVVMGLFGDSNIKLLNYNNSGDITGENMNVVGYASIVFMDSKSSLQSENELGIDEQKRLLEIARQSLESYVKTGKKLEFSEKSSALNEKMGAFVTLKLNNQLRGCIGIFSSEKEPLYQVVAEMAIAAGIDDPRFSPVIEKELGDLEYEISVLSPLKKIDSWQEIEIGKHGVKVVKGSQSGVFLPQVATENNWDLETFMNVLCEQKAGLPGDCWKDKDIDIYVFTAQVFNDKDFE